MTTPNEYSQKSFSSFQDQSLRTTPITQNQISPIASNQQKNERTKLLDQYERSLHDNNRNTASKDAEKILAEFQQRVMQMTQQSLNKQVQPDYNEYDDKDSLSEELILTIQPEKDEKGQIISLPNYRDSCAAFLPSFLWLS